MTAYALNDANKFSPSPVFGLLLAFTVALGAMLWRGGDISVGNANMGVFFFVVAGWMVSLSLHEFGHAVAAFIGGDRSVADKGYLTLDFRQYVEPGMSLVFPMLFLLLGGIGLPGGAVWINQGMIRSPNMRSVVAAAGPAANLVCALICLVPFRLGLYDGADSDFVVAIAFLGALQIIALVLNLVPIPGLDGFAILEPHLSRDILIKVQPARQYGLIAFFVLLWFFPPVRNLFWGISNNLVDGFGGPGTSVLQAYGWLTFRFWG